MWLGVGRGQDTTSLAGIWYDTLAWEDPLSYKGTASLTLTPKESIRRPLDAQAGYGRLHGKTLTIDVGAGLQSHCESVKLAQIA